MSRRMTRATADSLSAASTQLPSSNYIAPSTVMYINSQCNHPAFNKLYLGPNLSQNGKMVGATSAVPKPPKPPEKPLMPYLRYSRKQWDSVKANQPDLKLSQVGKIIGKMWRDLPSADRQLYVDEYETEKAEYQEMLRSYHNSPAYQGYLQAKGRAEAIEAENRASERDGSIMSIEPTDDGSGDTDEGFSVKHVSAARFQRNHRLMQNILLDTTVVPSSRGIVTEQRLEVLRHQVQSLEHHQKKLEAELGEIEKNHIATKRKWKESTSNFITDLKKLRSMTPQECYAQFKKKQAEKMQAEAAEKAAQEEKNKAKSEETPPAPSNDVSSETEASKEKSATAVDEPINNQPTDIADSNNSVETATKKEPEANADMKVKECSMETEEQDKEKQVTEEQLSDNTPVSQPDPKPDFSASSENVETANPEKAEESRMEE